MHDFLPPQNLDAERAVLGALMLSDSTRDEVLGRIEAREFYAHAHQEAFRVMHEMADAGESLDTVTVAERLSSDGLLADIGGPMAIMSWLETCQHVAHVGQYVDIIREKYRLRSVREAFTTGLRGLNEPGVTAEQILEDASRTISAMQELGHGDTAVSIRDVLLSGFDAIMHGEDSPTVPTGYHDLDKLLSGGGLREGSLTIIAARPSVGKTAIALNMMLRMARHERSGRRRACLFFSLEQPRLDISERLLSTAACVDSSRIQKPALLSDDERDKLLRISTTLSELPIEIDESSDITVSRMLAVSRRIQRRQGLAVVFVDYLQLLTPSDRRVPREQQIAQMTRDLKNMARQLSVPVVCLAQLNRQVESREDRKPQMAHLRESGSVEQDADVVCLLWRPADAKAQQNKPDGSGRAYGDNEIVLLLEKQRNGPTGMVDLIWQKEIVAFHDRAYDHQAAQQSSFPDFDQPGRDF